MIMKIYLINFSDHYKPNIFELRTNIDWQDWCILPEIFTHIATMTLLWLLAGNSNLTFDWLLHKTNRIDLQTESRWNWIN